MAFSIKKLLKGIFKVLLWITGVVVVLLISVALLIQLPPVQNKIISYGTKYVSDKTHTRVEIAQVGITFPKSVFIKGIFLEDQQHDTLLYAGKIKVDMDMFSLIKSKIHINSLTLQDINGKISRTENDSLFNFNFLITAFSNPDKEPVEKDTAKKKTDFDINKVNLENIRFIYDDRYSGTVSDLRLQKLDLNIDKLDPESRFMKLIS